MGGSGGGAGTADAAGDGPRDGGSGGGASDAPIKDSNGKDSTGDAPSKDASGADAATKDASDGSAADANGDAAACYGNTGTPGSCTGLFPACNWQEMYCQHAGQIMKAGVAQAAVSCIEGLAGTCDSFGVYGCVRTALGGACVDATASTLCSTIEGSCFATNPIGSFDCHKLVDGLTDMSRARVEDCIVPPDGGARCQVSLWSCIEGL
jgi:hypothetical protein